MYNSFFNFTESPFNVTPDPRFLFLTDSHREALASMIYAIVERKGFISLTGQVGTGKTTLVRRVLEDLKQKKIQSVYIYPGSCTIKEMLQEILHELDLPAAEDGKLSLTRRLNEFLIQGLGKDQNLALIIDEAHNLQPEVMEELRLLSNLETNSAKLLQIALVGQPELCGKLNAPELKQLRQRIAISRTIRTLTLEESRQYIDHRLKLVGTETSHVFGPDAMRLICNYSRGIPRIINILCDNSLLIGYGLKQKKIDARIVKEAIDDMALSLSSGLIAHSMDTPEEEGRKERSVAARRRDSLRRGKLFASYGYRKLAGIAVIPLCLFLALFWIWESRVEVRIRPMVNGRISSQEISADKLKADTRETTYPIIPASAPIANVKEPGPPPEHSPLPPVPVSGPNTPNTEPNIKNVIIVRKGETLSLLAQKYYEFSTPTVIDKIREFNPEITNIHLVNAGQRIRLPQINEESMVTQTPGGHFWIHLATVSHLGYAGRFRGESILRGKSIDLRPQKIAPGETWYRIYAGDFAKREEAIAALKSIWDKNSGLVIDRMDD